VRESVRPSVRACVRVCVRVCVCDSASLSSSVLCEERPSVRGGRSSQPLISISGAQQDVVPIAQYTGEAVDPAWEGAFPLLALYLYQYTGDDALLRKYYANLPVIF